VTSEITRIEQKYNITHKDGVNVYLAELIERPDPANITADCPADRKCRVSTNDGQHNTDWASHVDMPFSHSAAYYPTLGQRGWFHALCEDARVDGLGWAYGVPADSAPHRNVAVRFGVRSTPPPPTDGGWEGAFQNYFMSHPEIGPALGPAAYVPEPGVWRCCAQVSKSTLLVWDGWNVIPLSRS
jgi:hypothetical protein